MSYKAKDGKNFGNHQRGRAYDEHMSSQKQNDVALDIGGDQETTSEPESAGNVTCPHCGEEIKLEGSKHEAEESKESQHDQHEGAEAHNLAIPGM